MTEKTCNCGRADCDWLPGTCPREPRGSLQRRQDAGGPRDFLAGRPVHAGVTLERLAGDVERGRGEWKKVRYECRPNPGGVLNPLPVYVDDAGEHRITGQDVFRWPWPTGRRA